MSKFNVGDKVKIVRCSGDGGLSLDERGIAVGEEYIIESVNPNRLNLRHDHYGLVGRTYVVYDLELELVEAKPFTKADLKDGMVIEYRDGDRRIVLNNKFVWRSGYLDFENFNDDFVLKGGSYEIVKIYVSSATNLDDWCNDRFLELIWERKEEPIHKEMTVEEIEKELGYKIKVIADNDLSNK